MSTFKDAKDREWSITIDAPTILRVREQIDPSFLLGDTDEKNTYSRMQGDPVLLCQVLYVLCAKQRQERSVNDEEFYMSVVGNAIDGATEAMLQAILSFIPRRTRNWLEVSAAKLDKFQQLAAKRAIEKISDPTLESKAMQKFETDIDEAISTALMPLSSATSSPDS